MDNLDWLQHLHLLRPYWLLAIIPLVLLIWLRKKSQNYSRSWSSVVDPELLPHLLHGKTATQARSHSALLFILGLLAIIALAGPAYEKRPQPVFKTKSALIILLDLSRSMDATDIKPSRLQRARFKVEDILKLRREGQTALIAYAADAYVVSPLTEDSETITAQLPALETAIMPAQGSRLDRALLKAQELFSNAGHNRGQLIVITDGVNEQAYGVLQQLRERNYTTSILAIGTEDGAPIAAGGGGFVKDKSGAIVIPRVDIQQLQRAALTGGGLFSPLSVDDRDIRRLLSTIDIKKADSNNETTGAERVTDGWHEEGPWLLLLILPFAAYAFRKGLIFLFLITVIPLPQPAQALDWNSLWKNNDQRAQTELKNGNASQAAELFEDPQWKAAAEYRAGNYDKAAELYQQLNNGNTDYNRGNALARAGKLEQALQAYDAALQKDPQHEDARHNRQLVEQALQQSQQQQSSDQQQDSSRDEQNNDSQQDSSSGNNSQQNTEDNNSQSQPGNQAQNSQSSQQPEPQQSTQQQQSDATEDDLSQAEQSSPAAEQKGQQQETQQQDNQQSQLSQSDETPDLDQQQTQQWLKKIPDDPGGLLRRKFHYQYGRNPPPSEDEAW